VPFFWKRETWSIPLLPLRRGYQRFAFILLSGQKALAEMIGRKKTKGGRPFWTPEKGKAKGLPF
jgi:hypothetical protein